MVPERHTQDKPVDGDNVVLPDHVVHGVDALVDMPTTPELAELVDQEVTESPEVLRELLRANPLEHLVSNGRDIVCLEDHLPEEAEEEVVVPETEVRDDIVLIVHCAPGAPLLLHTLLQLTARVLGAWVLREQVHQDRREALQSV